MILFSSLQSFRARLTEIAESRGVSSNQHVIVSFNDAETGHNYVRVIVSYYEPTMVTSPLNIMWFVKDPSSTDFDKILRRVSRSNSSGSYAHEWIEVTDFSTVFDTQIWDLTKPDEQFAIDHSTVVGNPHNTRPIDIGAVDLSGDQMTGSLLLRSNQDIDTPEDDEAVSSSWVRKLVKPIETVAESAIQSYDSFFSQIDNLRDRVEYLESIIFGIRGYTYTQQSAAITWNINHNLANIHINVTVYEEDEMVIPASIKVTDVNNVEIGFAEPILGRAEITPLVPKD